MTPHDIAKALREWADAYDDSMTDAKGHHYDVCTEAADLIEAQAKVVDAARDLIKHKTGSFAASTAAIDVQNAIADLSKVRS